MTDYSKYTITALRQEIALLLRIKTRKGTDPKLVKSRRESLDGMRKEVAKRGLAVKLKTSQRKYESFLRLVAKKTR